MNEPQKRTLITKYREDFDRLLERLDSEPQSLVLANRDFKALLEYFEISKGIMEIHDVLSSYFEVIYRNQDVLNHFGSEKLKQIGHEVVPIRKCIDDSDIDEDFKETYVKKELRNIGYRATHWRFKEVFLLEIKYMLDVLHVVIEPEYIPLEERGDESEPRPDRYISPDVKINVWRRDSGKCSTCGTKEKLEYDHIIPVSKGGSNTERNIQLLCEKCNREKAARIA